MFQFLWFWIWLLLPLPWLLPRLLPAASPSAEGTLFAPVAAAMAETGQGVSGQIGRDRFLHALGLLCWLLLLAATARPQWLGEPVELPQTGRNLLLAVDVSGSMDTADMDAGRANRLDVVKRVAGEFFERREGDRLGLILFGTQAYLQAPLTQDRSAVKTLLDESVIGIAGRETAIGDAIGLALKRLRGEEGEAVLILLTDGANTAGSALPRKAAELAAQQGLRIHTIGIGSTPRAVRGLFNLQLLNPAAFLDEETLQYIADTTGGRYFRASDGAQLEGIYQKLDQLEPVTGGSRTVRPVAELYPWPLATALLLSMAAAVVRYRRGSVSG